MRCAARGRSDGNGEYAGYVRSFRGDGGDGDGKSCGLASGQPIVGRVEGPDSHGGCDSRNRWGVVETITMHSTRPALADRQSGERKPVVSRSEWGGSVSGRSPRREDNHG